MTKRSPASYNFAKLQFNERLLTKHFTPMKSKDVKYVVVHHMTIVGKGNGSALDVAYSVWQSRKASANYGVDGNFITQFVWDKDYAWAQGSTEGNLYGISIEHANKTAGPKWLVSDDTWKTGAKLAAYIHKMYKLGRPRSGVTLRKHSSFHATACPGPFLGGSNWDEYVKECQRVYDEITSSGPVKPKSPGASTGEAPKRAPGALLKLGSSGAPVRKLKERMNIVFKGYAILAFNKKAGFSCHKLTENDKFDLQLSLWIKEFQKRTRLTVDGIVGPKTQARLLDFGIKIR